MGGSSPWRSTSPCSALPVPAPDGSVVAHGYQDAAVAAEAGLPDGGRAFGERQRGAPKRQRRGGFTCGEFV